MITPRRRYRQKKIISDDEDGSDTSENYSKYIYKYTNRLQMGRGGGGGGIVDQKNNLSTNTNNQNNNKNNCNLSKNRVNFDANTLKMFGTDIEEVNIESVTNNNNNNNNNSSNNNNNKQVKKEDFLYESLENLKCNKEKNVDINLTKMTESNLCCLVNEEASAINKEHNKFDNNCIYNPNMNIARRSSSKKKNNRRSRSRKQRISPDASRIRSLSVGNNDQDIPWKNSRRHELIEIIRTSMEKNRLCFQPKR